MKIPLSLHREYVPSWGIFEGIREFLQEALDARDEGFKTEIKFLPSEKVRIIVEDKILDREALLLGYSTKRNNQNLRGQHGEGFKLAMLVLTRCGYTVWIKTGGEIWKPKFEKSAQFKTDTLVVETSKAPKAFSGTQIEVRGVTKEDWEIIRPCFLDLIHIDDDEVITVPHRGRVLKGERFADRLYVGGIFVQNLKEGYSYGFDVHPAHLKLDRDRRTADSFYARWEIRELLRLAFNREQVEVADVFDLIEAGKGEAKAFENDYGKSELGKAIADEFERRYGENAVPVNSIGEAHDIEHFGKRAVVTNKAIQKVIANNLGDLAVRKLEFGREATFVQLDELTAGERAILDSAVRLINSVYAEFSIDLVQVVEFADDKTNALFNKESKVTQIARRQLASYGSTIVSLSHEASHQWGGDDGSLQHDSVQKTFIARVIDILIDTV
jgi:hypothetical protein